MDVDQNQEEQLQNNISDTQQFRKESLDKYFDKIEKNVSFLYFICQLKPYPDFILKSFFTKSRYTSDFYTKYKGEYSFSDDFKTALKVTPSHPKEGYATLWAKYQLNKAFATILRFNSRREGIIKLRYNNKFNNFNLKFDIQGEKSQSRDYRWIIQLNRHFNPLFPFDYLPFQQSSINFKIQQWDTQIKLLNSNKTKNDWKIFSQATVNYAKRQLQSLLTFQLQSPEGSHITSLDIINRYKPQLSKFQYKYRYLFSLLKQYKFGLSYHSNKDYELIFQYYKINRLKFKIGLNNNNVMGKIGVQFEHFLGELRCKLNWKQYSIPLISLKLYFNF